MVFLLHRKSYGMMRIFIISVLSSCIAATPGSDYWNDDNFDSDKNCRNMHEDMEQPTAQCETVRITHGVELAFSQCIIHLEHILDKLCDFSKVRSPGELKYCNFRGQLICCFVNHTCATWGQMDRQIYKYAKEYLEDRKTALGNMVDKEIGYKSCHHLGNSTDATECAEDCKKLEKGSFAKNCSDTGGLFKCCIRRDKRGCHNCRFCCTLSMCTHPPGGRDATTFDEKIRINEIQTLVKAKNIFWSHEVIYKNYDYRCVKPFSHSDPEKWHYYDMEPFRNAYNAKTFKQVPSFKYEYSKFNFEDPKVFKKFTKSRESSKKYWRKSYGFKYSYTIPGPKLGKKKNLPSTIACIKKCLKLESSKFAQNCRKKGGVFKCCVSDFRLHSYEEARVRLVEAGLMQGSAKRVCSPKAKVDPCHVCTLDAICTTEDSFTGVAHQSFYQGIKKEDKVGGPDNGPFGMRYSWCNVLDLCKSKANIEYYDHTEFQQAKTKEEVCKVGRRTAVLDLQDSEISEEAKIRKDLKMCSKIHHSNIFICAEEEQRNITDPKVLSFLEQILKEKLNKIKLMKRKMHDTKKKRDGWKVKVVEVPEAGEDLHVAEAGETLHVAEAADISNNDIDGVTKQREETKENTKDIKDELDENLYKMKEENKGIPKQGFPEETRKGNKEVKIKIYDMTPKTHKMEREQKEMSKHDLVQKKRNLAPMNHFSENSHNLSMLLIK